jgi:peptidoglycan/xylan/chitin deacetylase (PgdA/CDA1 family)
VAVAVTFDNLGEASEIASGAWPDDRPRGRHPSVDLALPRVLALLAELDLRATFFVEGINAELYPAALRAIADAGHEVACHAWCHEDWGALEPAEEARALARATEALRALGAPLRGFRPPGGRLNPDSASLLRRHGYAYASPARGSVDGLPLVPFDWPLVDAYHRLPLLRLTVRGGAPRAIRRSALARGIARVVWGRRSEDGVRRGRDAMLAAVRDASDDVVLVLHPFLLDDDAALQAAADVLGAVGEGVTCSELVARRA